MDFFSLLSNFFTAYGYWAVFIVLIVCGLGVPIPEDITLISAGFIAFLGSSNIHFMFFVSMLGVLLGDGLMFGAGYYLGDDILKIKFIAKIITPKRYYKVQEKFDKYGNWVLFIARFLPGLRAAIYISAGFSRRVSYFKFFLLDGLAALISVPIWVYIGYFGAKNIDFFTSQAKKFQLSLVVIILILLISFIVYYREKKKARIKFFKKNRKKLFRKKK